jgi:hypothetical protein
MALALSSALAVPLATPSAMGVSGGVKPPATGSRVPVAAVDQPETRLADRARPDLGAPGRLRATGISWGALRGRPRDVDLVTGSTSAHVLLAWTARRAVRNEVLLVDVPAGLTPTRLRPGVNDEGFYGPGVTTVGFRDRAREGRVLVRPTDSGAGAFPDAWAMERPRLCDELRVPLTGRAAWTVRATATGGWRIRVPRVRCDPGERVLLFLIGLRLTDPWGGQVRATLRGEHGAATARLQVRRPQHEVTVRATQGPGPGLVRWTVRAVRRDGEPARWFRGPVTLHSLANTCAVARTIWLRRGDDGARSVVLRATRPRMFAPSVGPNRILAWDGTTSADEVVRRAPGVVGGIRSPLLSCPTLIRPR